MMTKQIWKTVRLGLVAALATAAFASKAESSPYYVEAAVGALMPSGGRDFSRGALWSVRAGASVSDQFNLEAEFGESRVNVFSARALWRPVGYETVDPFLSLGASAFGNSRWTGGPEFGVGFFWYLGDRLSLRFDLRTAIDPKHSVGVVSSAMVGLGWSF